MELYFLSGQVSHQSWVVLRQVISKTARSVELQLKEEHMAMVGQVYVRSSKRTAESLFIWRKS
jgi:hypothetical protein